MTDYPSCPLPPLPTEVARARAEDPGFAEVLGRARATARGVEYDPEIHHPNAPRGAGHDHVTPEHIERMYELIDRWTDRGAGVRHLRALPSDRPGVRRVREL